MSLIGKVIYDSETGEVVLTDLFAIIAGGFNAIKQFLKDELQITKHYIKTFAFLSILSFGIGGLLLYKERLKG